MAAAGCGSPTSTSSTASVAVAAVPSCRAAPRRRYIGAPCTFLDALTTLKTLRLPWPPSALQPAYRSHSLTLGARSDRSPLLHFFAPARPLHLSAAHRLSLGLQGILELGV